MKCDDQIKNRIKRTQGQMKGVLQMMENEEACLDIVTQLKAIRSSIDKAIGLITANNLVQTIEKKHLIELDEIDDAINLIVKGM